MPMVTDPYRAVGRAARAVIGGAVVWLTVLAFTRMNPVDLTIALLIVIAEVLVVAALSGPLLAVAVALGAVFLVNWYLVPPYGTFQVANSENVVELIVFAFVAGVAAYLVELGARARARADESDRQAELLGTVVAATEGDDTRTALERVRSGLRLDEVELRGPLAGSGDRVLVTAGTSTDAPIVLDVSVPDGYRLVGRGAEIFAPDPDFLESLAAAAARAYESERMQQESLRAEELAAVDRARIALLASVGHDLRTPLSTLRVSIDALTAPAGLLTDEDRSALLRAIESSTDRLDALITNLLNMSRLQAGVVLAHPERTSLLDVVERVLLPWPADRFEVVVPDGLPAVSADPALLEQIIANLASNALRYSPAEQPVLVHAHHDARTVTLEVEDHGPGLSPSEAAEVFTPFHRVGAQPDGGTGLGLAIVRGFAEAMGMTVDLRPGAVDGLCARVVMPRWDAEAEAL